MKKITLLASFVSCLFLQVHSQTSFNNTIVNDHTAWATLGIVTCSNCPIWTEYIYFDGDSVFSNNSYKKIFSTEDKLHEKIQYKGLMREQNKKTYFIPVDSMQEYVIYDFSLKKDMSFNYIEPWSGYSVEYYVNKIDSIEINGIQKQRIQLTEQPHSDYTRATWIENVGSLNGLFYPCGVLVPGSTRTLLCYFQNSEVIYKNQEYSKCYYDNDDTLIKTTITDNNYTIFPNPVDDVLNIVCLDNTISRIDFFDVSGQHVYRQSYQEMIDIGHLQKGFYLLKVYDINDKVSAFKIFKK
ncbi:MAG: T9SS type A sorting domain-containing protein [Paludibacteraceae bacterium]|jgi:hypothetical protein|nr:T9SS type A sorting domain-containing protein [Paludibacteraceae bacterium]